MTTSRFKATNTIKKARETSHVLPDVPLDFPTRHTDSLYFIVGFNFVEGTWTRVATCFQDCLLVFEL